MAAIQLELIQREKRSESLEAENKTLVLRWLKKMQDDAEKMNEANDFVTT